MSLKQKVQRHYQEHKVFINIVIGLVLCIAITVLSLSSILYISFERISLSRAYSSSMSHLAKTSKDADIMIEISSNLVNQIYRDPLIAPLAFPYDPDVYELQSIISGLKNYSTVMPFIDSIYVYNKNTGVVYVASNVPREVIQDINSFDDQDVFRLIENYHDYQPFSPIPRKFLLESNNARHCYTYLAFDWFNRSVDLESAVVVNFSTDFLQSTLDSGKESVDDNTIIIDSTGTSICNSPSFPMMQDMSGEKYIAEIISTNNSGYLVEEVNGVLSLVVYTEPDARGWRYIRILPYSFVTSDIDRMRSYNLTVTFITLGLGLILIFFASKQLYEPFKKIAARLGDLELFKTDNFETLRQEFLRTILFKRKQYSNDELYSNFVHFKINFNLETQYYVVLIKMDRYSSFARGKSLKELNAEKRAMMELAERIYAQEFIVETVDVDDDSICLFLNLDAQRELVTDNIFEALFAELQQIVMKTNNVSLTAAISEVGSGIDDVPDLFQQAIAAVRYRTFSGHGSIIFARDVLKRNFEEYNYPLEKEKALIDALMAGKVSEAQGQYLNIMDEVKSHSILVLNLVVSRLAFTINAAVTTIQKNNNLPIQEIPDVFYALEGHFETIDEINLFFLSLFDQIDGLLKQKANLKYIELCDKIDWFIENQYMDSALSLDSIADSLGLSAAHITRVYKQYRLKTIAEAILEYRMNVAKDLLLNTDLPVKEISQMTGFTYDSYFYTVFKKENGVTPANYRKNARTPRNHKARQD